MPVNVLLVRWTDGWREVSDPASITTYGRREALLGLGAVQSPQEVDRVARMQLALFADQRTAIATDIDPRAVNDRPYQDFGVGDTITVPDYGTGTISQRVRAITGAEDENGEITYSVELGDLILEEQERTLATIKKMADGTLDGESAVATPVSGVFNLPKIFGSMPGPRAWSIASAWWVLRWNETSAPYTFDVAGTITSMEVVATADTGRLMQLIWDNSPGGAAVIASVTEPGAHPLNIAVRPGMTVHFAGGDTNDWGGPNPSVSITVETPVNHADVSLSWYGAE